jgi:hypothetical protein
MHKEILSDRDRVILHKFVQTSEKLQGFRLVKFKILKRYEQLSQDFRLIEEAYKKFNRERLNENG